MNSQDLKCKACNEWFSWENANKHWMFKCNPDYMPPEPNMPFVVTRNDCEHEWSRRRDGRRCHKCEKIEFGI